jgi:hypothetical protein
MDPYYQVALGLMGADMYNIEQTGSFTLEVGTPAMRLVATDCSVELTFPVYGSMVTAERPGVNVPFPDGTVLQSQPD